MIANPILSILVIDTDLNRAAQITSAVRNLLPDADANAIPPGEAEFQHALSKSPSLVLLPLSETNRESLDFVAAQLFGNNHFPFPFVGISTADTSAELRHIAFNAGIDGIISSPFDDVDLLLQSDSFQKRSTTIQAAQSNSVSGRSEEHQRMLQKVANVGSWVWHVQNDRLELSDQIFEITGITKDDLSSKSRDVLIRAIHPDDRGRVVESARSVAELAQPIQLEFRLIRPDGTVRTVWAEAGQMELDDDGTPRTLAGIVQDITDQKQRDIALAESKERFELAIRATNDGIYDWNLQTNEIWYSPAWKSMLGYNEDELPNDFTVWEQLTHPDDVKRSWEMLNELLANKRDRFEMEFKMLHKNGRWVDILSRADAVFDAAGNAVRVLGTHVDISALKQAEKSLRESEERYRLLYNNMSQAFVLHEVIEDEQGEAIDFRFVEINPGYETLVGISAGELRGKTLTQTFTNVASRWFDHYNLVKKLGSAQVYSDYSPEIDKYLEVWGFIPKPGFWATMLTDITSKRSADEELRISEMRFRAITETAQDAIIVIDANACVLYWNPSAEVIFGYAADEVTGKYIPDLIVPERYRTRGMSIFSHLVVGERGDRRRRSLQLTGCRKDGVEIDISFSLSSVVLDNQWQGMAIIRDITDWRFAKATLRESEARFRDMVVHSPFAYQSLDSTGCIIDANETMCNLLGYTREEFIGKKFAAFWVDEGANDFSAAFGILLQSGRYSGDIQLIRKDDVNLVVFLEARVQYDRRGNFLRAHAVLFDITARVQSERSLRASEELFRALFQDHAAIKLLVDPISGLLVDVNAAAVEFYGWSHEELSQMRIWDLNMLPAQELVQIMDNVIDAKPSFFEFRHRRADGSVRDVEVYAGAVTLKGKNLIHSIIHDVTDKKEAEARSRLMGRSIEQTPVSVVITDPEGTIEYVNPEFVHQSGYSAEELRGNNPRILSSGQQPLEFYASMWTTILSGKDWIGEMHNRRKNGELYWESAIISPVLNEKGVITHFIGVKVDITEQKKLMAELVSAKERAEESDRLKSTFLANMSHEVRTPMNAIIGFSDLLTDEGLSREEQITYTEIVRQRSYDLLGIINDILNISLLDAGQLRIILEKANVEEILTEMHQSFVQLAKVNDKLSVKILCKVELPSSSKTMMLDTGRLRQILTNLLSNALKFTEQGSITFGCRMPDAAHILFYVTDTGIGISPEDQEIIFNRFRQADESSTRRFGGTGLGLSISKGLVELMGGTLNVRSEVGAGSTFEFILPYRSVELPESASLPD